MPFYLHVGANGQSFRTFTIQIRNQDTGVLQPLTLGADVDWAGDVGKDIELRIVNAVTVPEAPVGSYIFGKKM